jgi:hypothetical protein
MNPFWSNFWSNFLANLGVVVVLSALGYVAKGKIARNLKNFIDSEVSNALVVINKAKGDKSDLKN